MLTVIVGVGPGLGMSLARRFGREGHELALLVRDEASGAGFVAELAVLGARASAYAADIGDEAALRAAFADIRAAQGDPDVTVFNASVGAPGSPGDVATGDLEDAFRVGVLGAVWTLQEVLPAMRERDAGVWLATGSGVALRPWPAGTPITLAKAALRAYVLAAARDVEGTGVHVGTVTIDGVLGVPGFEPDTIAERFWALAAEPRGSFTTEVVHTG
jgi:NAD(P)-dependent dehydrogenase (short-subunit alcohol dehydrogenase family)